MYFRVKLQPDNILLGSITGYYTVVDGKVLLVVFIQLFLIDCGLSCTTAILNACCRQDLMGIRRNNRVQYMRKQWGRTVGFWSIWQKICMCKQVVCLELGVSSYISVHGI